MKTLYWMGDSLDRLGRFPSGVKQEVGYALYLAQQGDKHPHAKPLRGFTGAGTLEIISQHRGDTYRAVYTVTIGESVYVLHAFQKKSKRGISTPKQDLECIKSRLKQARAHFASLLQERKGKQS